MTYLFAFLALVAHLALMLAAAPLFTGIVRWLKARLLGRIGPPPMQPWRDLLRLARKQPVVADNTSWLFRAAPAGVLAATIAAASLVPSFTLGMASAPEADLLVLAGLLGLARCILALAAMDTGTSFGGIGASREMAFSVFAEPALLLVIFALALMAGTTNLDAIAALLREGALGLRVSLGLSLLSLLMIAIAECGRLPAGSTRGHLELAMVHEAMTLEYSGRHLALIEWAGSLSLLVWLSLIVAIFAPFGIAESAAPWAWPVGLAVWAAKLGAASGLLAVFETTLAKMRIFRVPEFLGAAVLLGLLAVLFLFVSQGFA